MKAPGARTNTKMASPPMNFQPKMEPLPNISRIEPKMVSAIEYPKPMLMPSMAEAPMPFFEANASARPKTIQLTTMSGMKRPSVSSSKDTFHNELFSSPSVLPVERWLPAYVL